MKRNLKQRILALFLVLVIAGGLFPSTALAAESNLAEEIVKTESAPGAGTWAVNSDVEGYEDGWFYYIDTLGENYIYREQFITISEGQEKVASARQYLTDYSVDQLLIYQGQLFYSVGNEIFMLDIDSGKVELILTESLSVIRFALTESSLYYHVNKSIKRYCFVTDTTSTVLENAIEHFWMDDADHISYLTDGEMVYLFELETQNITSYRNNATDLGDVPLAGSDKKGLSINSLRSKFPHGKYWNHVGNPGAGNNVNNQNGYTSSPCPVHGVVGTSRQTCNGFQPGTIQLSWQCMGYAEKCGYDATGYNPRDNANGWYTNTSSSALNTLKAGDIVRYKNDEHSIYVISVSGDTVTYTDCNSDGHCIIRWDATISKSTLRSTFTNVRVAPSAAQTQPCDITFSTKNHSVTIDWNDVGASSYYLYVQNLDTGEIPYGNNLGKWYHCYLSLGAGRYRLFVTAVYTSDVKVSSWVDFTLYSYQTTTNKGKTACFNINEPVTFFVDTDNCTKCYYIIYHTPINGEEYLYEEGSVNTSQLSKSFDKAGSYRFNFGVFSTYGYTEAAWANIEVDNHKYVSTDTISTCTDQGYTTHTCSVCGNSYKDSYTAALGHSYSYKVTTAPTTSATGKLTGTCSRCSGTTSVTLPKLNTTDYSYTVTKAATCTATGTGRYTWKTTTYGTFYFDVSISATGHSYKSTVTAPTCTAQGYTTHTCTACGDSYKDTYTASLGHSYSYKATTAPTTSATGKLTGTCSRCSGTTSVTLPKLNTTDYTYSVVKAATCTATGTGRYTWKTTTYGTFYFDVSISATGHSYQATVTAPTCTAQGYTTHTCSTCGNSYKDTYTAALGHSYTYKATTAPTTSATGKLTGTCSRCSGTTLVDLPKLNTTDYTYSVVKAATCTATGTGRYTWKTTTYGTFYFDVSISATGHSYQATVTAPTCTAQGYTTHTCTACGNSYKDTYTAALGHSYSYKATTAPTTSTTGNLTGTCSRCSGTTSVTLPKLNTTDYTYSVVKAATCTATGTGRYTWKTTTYGTFYFDVSISATGHSYQATVTAPTCTAQGYTTHTCSVCGHSYVDSYTDPIGHSYGNWTTIKAPTCTEKGQERRDCNNCDHYETRDVSATGHSYKAAVTAPTCTVQGYTTHTCSACGHTYVDSYTTPTGHSYNSVVTAPTCTEQGYTTHTCINCGDSYVDSYTPASCPGAHFTDMPAVGHWAHASIDWAVANGITNGTSATKFSPNADCTRGQIVTFLWRAAGEPEPTATNNPFTDVDSDDFYYKAVLWAVENGITTGASATKFNPKGACNRAQVVTFMWRAKGSPTPTSANNPFGDVPADKYYHHAVLWAVENGITTGTSATKFAPNSTCTRGQIVTFLYRGYAK